MSIGEADIVIGADASGLAADIQKEAGPEIAKAGESEGTSFGDKFRGGLSKVGGVVAAAAAVGTAAAVGLTAAVVNGWGNLEQALGGATAVFQEFDSQVVALSESAYKNMGMSQTEYLGSINKMASLFKGSGMDIESSLDLSSAAMQRAADVASVMGIDTSVAMESITGAAKGNFEMMDNLGVAMNATSLEAYAASKGMDGFSFATASSAEKSTLAMEMFMERTQDSAGNFAREATQTVSGSIGMLQGSVSDFVAGLGSSSSDMGRLTGQVIESLTAVINNLEPVITNIAAALPAAIQGIIGAIAPMLPAIISLLVTLVGQILAVAPQIIQALIEGIVTAIPELITVVSTLVPQVITSLIAMLPMLLGAAVELFLGLVTGLSEALPVVIEALLVALPEIIAQIVGAIPQMLVAALDLFLAIIQGIVNALPEIIVAITAALPTMITALVNGLPQMVQGALQLFTGIVMGIIQNIPAILSAIIGLLPVILGALVSMIPSLLSAGIDLIGGLIAGLWDAAGGVGAALLDIAKNAIDGFLGFLGIKSPSRLMMGYGENIGEGAAIGIEKSGSEMQAAMDGLAGIVSGTDLGAPGIGATGDWSLGSSAGLPAVGELGLPSARTMRAALALSADSSSEGEPVVLKLYDVDNRLIGEMQAQVDKKLESGSSQNLRSELGVI